MAIDIQTAKTLVNRIDTYLQADQRDPTFVLNGLFNDIRIDDDNTMSSIGNFLFQLRFDGEHLYDFVKEAAAEIDVFKPFSITCTNMRLYLTPNVIREGIKGLYTTQGEFFNINFIEHTYDERVDRVLHEMEDPIVYPPQAKSEREQVAEEAEKIVKRYLDSSKLKYRLELMRLELRTSKKSVWLSREVSLPVRVIRNMRRIRSAATIFCMSKQRMIEFARRQSQKKVAQYQSERRDDERNKKRAQWKVDHHDTVVAQCDAVREWLHEQGYERSFIEYWH